jgi:hypothetical protein
MNAPILLLCCVALLSACHGPTITNNGQTVYARNWNEAVRTLSGRAQYDLRCEQDSVTYKLVARQGRIPVQVLAEGCGARGLYGRTVRASHAWSRLDGPTGPASAVNVNVSNTVIVGP